MESLITWILRTSYWRLMRLSKSIQSVNSTVNYSQLQTPFLSWSFSFHWDCVLQVKVTALPMAFRSCLTLAALLRV